MPRFKASRWVQRAREAPVKGRRPPSLWTLLGCTSLLTPEGWLEKVTFFSTDVSNAGIAIRNHPPNHYKKGGRNHQKWVVWFCYTCTHGFESILEHPLKWYVWVWAWHFLIWNCNRAYIIHVAFVTSMLRRYWVHCKVQCKTMPTCPMLLDYSPTYWYSVYPWEFTVECIVFPL